MKRPNIKIDGFQREVLIRVFDGVISTIVMILAINSFFDVGISGTGKVTGALLVALTVFHLMKAIVPKVSENKVIKVARFLIAGTFLVTAVLFFVFGTTDVVLRLYGILFSLSLCTDRVASILQKKGLRDILWNSAGLCFLAILLLAILISDSTSLLAMTFIVGLLIAAQSLLHIVLISFSQMKLDILLKVIRKTFAPGILFGLLLLIIAFSFVFQKMDPGIETYADALWYCFSVVTTIGFGDTTVTSHLCRALSIVLGIYGIVVVALITSVIVNFYNEIKNEKTEFPPASDPVRQNDPSEPKGKM